MMTEQQYSALLDGVKHVHFIGVGGSGMYPLVQILHEKGYQISGSDVLEGSILGYERAMGVTVYMGHRAEQVNGADLVVYSAAIHPDNCEYRAAHEQGIPCIERSILLGYVSRLYPRSICVSGTHGKTTTTSLITTLLELAGRGEAAVIGGKLPLIEGYGKAGSGDEIVIEACEFSRTFLELSPKIAVVLNIDNDHLDYYGSMENLKDAFHQFAELSRGYVVANGDDANTMEAMAGLHSQLVTFGLSGKNEFSAAGITEYRPGFFAFDALHRGEFFAHLELNVPGLHNVANALSMCAVCWLEGLTGEDAVKAARSFSGAGRRFEVLGECSGAVVVDDYAHHPTEIKVTLEAAREMGYDRVIAVHQPFTYSRTYSLLDDFVEVLSLADVCVLTPILGSREVDTGLVKTADLAARLPGSVEVDSLEAAAQWVKANCKKGDLVITLGCGDVYKAAKRMIEL